MLNVMSFTNYRDVIHFFITKNKSVRGYKTAMARAGKIQPSYFSAVLNMASELSLDQASSLADYWDLSSVEAEYFITLVIIERASTANLKARYKLRLSEIRSQASQQGLKNSIKNLSDWLSMPRERTSFHSAWTFMVFEKVRKF